MRRGWVTALLAGVVGWGVTIVVARRRPLELGRRRPRRCTSLAIGIPTTMAVAVASTCLLGPGSLATGSGPAGRRSAARARDASARSPCSAATASCCGSPARRGSVRSSPARRTAANGCRRATACGCGGCWRRPAASTSSSARSRRHRVDLLPAEICDGAGQAAEPGRRPSRPSRSRRCWRRSSAARSTTVFAEFDWEPLAAASIGQTYRGPAALGRAGGGQGAAPGHRGR